MAIPGENYILRLLEKEGNLIHMNVLDVVLSGPTERAALVEWAFGRLATAESGGFTILRFDPLGNVTGQISKTLCSFSGIECGEFQLETGTLLRLSDGFIVAGTATHLVTGIPNPVAIRLDNMGNVRWGRKYVGEIGHPTTARITSIVQLQAPDRFLVSAFTSDDETFFFQIEGTTGRIAGGGVSYDARIRRMRMTSLGVLAVGEMGTSALNPEPVIMAFDAVTAGPLWMRWWTHEDEGGDRNVRWYDIAEGNKVLLVVGNFVGHLAFDEIFPMMAFLDKASLPVPGAPIRVIQPTGPEAVHLRGVINHQDLVIPLTGDTLNSFFVVTGDANKQPWSFAIAEDQTVLWQKKLKVVAGSEGRLVPVVWPSYEEVISGGLVKTGSTQRGFLVSSPFTNGRGSGKCSEETKVTFPTDTKLSPHHGLLSPQPLPMHDVDWFTDQGRDLTAKKQCLDLQSEPPSPPPPPPDPLPE
jgi:hypothetical protein